MEARIARNGCAGGASDFDRSAAKFGNYGNRFIHEQVVLMCRRVALLIAQAYVLFFGLGDSKQEQGTWHQDP